MANRDAPHGLRARFAIVGDVSCSKLYTSDGTTAIGIGDPVLMTTDGYLQRASTGSDAIWGVAQNAVAASGTPSVLVNLNPYVVYSVQNDETEAVTDIGACADLTVGVPTSLHSIAEIDTSDVGSTTKDLKIIGELPVVSNATGANCQMLVILNESLLKLNAGI
jgi:hypothetical protein